MRSDVSHQLWENRNSETALSAVEIRSDASQFSRSKQLRSMLRECRMPNAERRTPNAEQLQRSVFNGRPTADGKCRVSPKPVSALAFGPSPTAKTSRTPRNTRTVAQTRLLIHGAANGRT